MTGRQAARLRRARAARTAPSSAGIFVRGWSGNSLGMKIVPEGPVLADAAVHDRVTVKNTSGHKLESPPVDQPHDRRPAPGRRRRDAIPALDIESRRPRRRYDADVSRSRSSSNGTCPAFIVTPHGKLPADQRSSRPRPRTTASARTAPARWTSSSFKVTDTTPKRRGEVMRLLAGIAAGVIASGLILQAVRRSSHTPTPTRLVAEDASAPLSQIAIHYAPAADHVALGVWRQLFAVLPPSVAGRGRGREGRRLRSVRRALIADAGHLERFHPVVVGTTITTWSRDRYAALVDDRGPRRDPRPAARRIPDARARRRRPLAVRDLARALPPRSEGRRTSSSRAATSPARRTSMFADINLACRNVRRTAPPTARRSSTSCTPASARSSSGSATPSATCRATTS